MTLSIRYKLLLILLLFTTLVIAAMMGFSAWTFQRGFVHFVEQTQQARVRTLVYQLAEIYDEEHGWNRLAHNPRRWARLVFSREGDEHDDEHREWQDARSSPPHRWPPRWRERRDGPQPFAFRVMLLDADGRLIYGNPQRLPEAKKHPISHDGTTIGYLAVLPGPTLSQLGELRFVERQQHAFLIIGVVMLIASALVALFLAGRLVRRLKAFTRGARALADARYDTRLPEQSRDELGQLARDFNALAAALARHESERRQWVADISHELRTPLSVIRGELEALQDGVRPLTPEAVTSLHTEVLRLGRLIDDLYELSRSDLGALSYRKHPVDPLAVLGEIVDGLQDTFADQGLTLKLTQHAPQALTMQADPDRLAQLFRNLLNNSLHYTDAGGRVTVSTRVADEHLVVDIDDSAPGVPAEHLPHLFDRLYRVEPSRSRAHGGAGLGLAICRNIVEAHGGEITATASPLGGLGIRLRLPVSS